MAHELPRLTEALDAQSAMTSEVVTARASRIHMDGGGIVHVLILEGSEQKLEDAVESVAIIARLAGGHRAPVLVDLRAMKSIDRAARAYYAGPAPVACFAATALVVASPRTRAIGNFFLGFNKPFVPMKLFADEEEALRWLTTYRN